MRKTATTICTILHHVAIKCTLVVAQVAAGKPLQKRSIAAMTEPATLEGSSIRSSFEHQFAVTLVAANCHTGLRTYTESCKERATKTMQSLQQSLLLQWGLRAVLARNHPSNGLLQTICSFSRLLCLVTLTRDAKGKCPNAAGQASSGIFLWCSYTLKCFHLTCFQSDYRLTDWWCWWYVLARCFLPTSCSRLWFIVAFVPLIRVPGSNRPSWLAWPQSKYSTETFFFVSVKRLFYKAMFGFEFSYN